MTVETRSNGAQTNMNDVIVRRHLASGQADGSFGDSGRYVFDNGGNADLVNQVLIRAARFWWAATPRKWSRCRTTPIRSEP